MMLKMPKIKLQTQLEIEVAKALYIHEKEQKYLRWKDKNRCKKYISLVDLNELVNDIDSTKQPPLSSH